MSTEKQIEEVLRGAPVPVPPPGLEARLVAGLRREGNGNGRSAEAPVDRPGFWRRWWPLGLPGLATAALATVAVVQQAELEALRSAPGTLAVSAAGRGLDVVAPGGPDGGVVPEAGTPVAAEVVTEIERLRALVAALSEEVSGLERLREENQRLLAEIAGQKGKLPPEVREMEVMKDKAERIRCVNNLKQLGLAVRIWASKNQNEFPPDLASLSSLVGSTKHLVCPSDATRQPALDGASVTEADSSYDFLAPGPGDPSSEPMRVMWRCPLHRNVTLVDGSVQQLTPERYEQMETRDGRLYMQPSEPRPNVPVSPAQP